MSLDSVLAEAVSNIPDCMAAGYIDLETGMLLGEQAAEPDGQAGLESVAVAVGNLFEGKGAAAFANLLNHANQDQPDVEGFGEVLIMADGRLHVFLRRKDYPHHVICFLFEETTNVGLALTRSHMNLPSITSQI